VGVRQNLLNLLMCYDPAYLKLALEVAYHQILVFSLGTEEASLSKFVEKVCFVTSKFMHSCFCADSLETVV
jgi:hypothetical protein